MVLNKLPKPSFITTPIFYVNSAPHIGHFYTVVLADAIHRWKALTTGTQNSIFTTGTDEHGLKIQQAAASHGQTPSQFCDKVSNSFRQLFQNTQISNTDFIRSTEPRHKKAVQHFWRSLYDKGHIYKGRYAGWYSTPDESFLTDLQIHDGVDSCGKPCKVSSESGHSVEWMEEENYLFKLSEFTPRLRTWLDDSPDAIIPGKFSHIVKQWLKEGLPDLSVSRQRSRLPWGVQVPDDPTQTVYVWLDALVNYLTVGGYPAPGHTWPADIHIVGKDILKFHAIYWPAFLMAAKLPLPGQIICHSHWTVGGQKMSKSKGNVVDPVEAMKTFTVDGLRYFLLKEGTLQSDADYHDHKVLKTVNADLADTLGNLLSRTTVKSLNPTGKYPPFHLSVFPHIHGDLTDTCRMGEEDYTMIEHLQGLPGVVQGYYEDVKLYKSLEAIILYLKEVNTFLQRHKPWLLRKDPAETPYLETVLHTALESVRVCGILLQPVVPQLTDDLLTRLKVGEDERGFAFARWTPWDEGGSIFKTADIDGSLGPLFTRIQENG